MELSIEEFTSGLCQLFQSKSYPEPEVTEVPDLTGSLRNKIDDRLRIYRNKNRTRLKIPTFYSLGVNEALGHQIISDMIGIFRSDKLNKSGNCFLFKVNGEFNFCVLIVDPWRVGICTIWDVEGKSWQKAFNDKKCEESRFDKDKISMFRSDLGPRFHDFLEKQICSTEILYRYLFMGLVVEIVKSQNPRLLSRESYQSIPFAACIKLALESGQSGQLQKVFGYTKPVNRDLNELIKEKNKVKKEEAKKIIAKFLEVKNLPMTRNTLQDILQESKKFYHL